MIKITEHKVLFLSLYVSLGFRIPHTLISWFQVLISDSLSVELGFQIAAISGIQDS